jgi:hypothetical protein
MTEHRHYDDRTDCTPLADDVCLTEMRSSDGTLTSFWLSHDSPNNDVRCENRIPLTGKVTWAMTGSLADGDLTLSPSILEHPSSYCPGVHGFVQQGKWVPA